MFTRKRRLETQLRHCLFREILDLPWSVPLCRHLRSHQCCIYRLLVVLAKVAQPSDPPELIGFALTRFRQGSTLIDCQWQWTHTHTHTQKSWGRASCSAPSDQQADSCVGCLDCVSITVRQTKDCFSRNLVAQYETAKVTIFCSAFKQSSGKCKHNAYTSHNALIIRGLEL